jgi:hypothetical protein
MLGSLLVVEALLIITGLAARQSTDGLAYRGLRQAAPRRAAPVASEVCRRVPQRGNEDQGCPSEHDDDSSVPVHPCSVGIGHKDLVDVQLAGDPLLQLLKRW